MAVKLKSVLNTEAFRPRYPGECASELEISLISSRSLMRQFIGGSEDNPVSTAKICFFNDPKHSSIESKPDFDPNMENHGVQMWAGTKKPLSLTSSIMESRSCASSPRIGRPSDLILPIASSLALNFFTLLISGK